MIIRKPSGIHIAGGLPCFADCPVQVFPFCNGPGRNFLDVMSRFHNYSVNNTMLISIQNPEARHLLEAVEKVCSITIHYKSMRTEYWAKRMVTMI